MSTFTIRVTSSATNTTGTAYGQQPDLGAPSFLDMYITGSTDPNMPDGQYDAYCLNPLINIGLSPISYGASSSAGNVLADFTPVTLSSLTQANVDQINWLLSQNFTSDPKYGGQFNFGEVQTAIWKIIGYTDAQFSSEVLFLNDNGRQVVSAADVNFLVTQSQAAVASGNGVVPTNPFFSTVIDPDGNVQPLIVQLQSAKLGNYVWLDGNSNGIQDSGEAGVDRVVVELYNSSGVLVASTVTGDDFSTAAVEHGFYQFAGLQAGGYQVKFVAPTYNFTTQDALGNSQDAADSDANATTGFSQVVTLVKGESNQTIDAGLVVRSTGVISGTVREDLDNNDTGDVPIPGVTITLRDGNGNVVGTTVTDANGFYSFTGLPGGNYTVVETNKPGYTDVGDVDGGNPNSVAVNLPAGGNSPGNDFVDERPAQLGDRVWLDANGNGQQDSGEANVAGVTVNLLNAAGAVVATQTTNATGNYLFTDLTPGTYSVQFVAPSGYLLTTKDSGADATDSDADQTTGKTGTYTLNSGDSNLTVDAGLVQKARIGDFVFEDKNANGVQDAGEAGIGGVTVTLCDAAGNPLATTTTNASGGYGFDVSPGTYSIKVSPPAGYFITPKDNAPNDATDSDIDAAGKSGNYTLVSGEVNNTVDAGLYKTATIGDRIWYDTNANGIQDAGEAGVANVRVDLLDNVGVGTVIASTTTDANGNYLFTNVTPGAYRVDIDENTLPAGYEFTVSNQGGDDALDSDINGAPPSNPAFGIMDATTLESGEDDRTWDAGIFKRASLGDRVWLDSNGNGVQDSGEAGKAGVTVNLCNAAGAVVATQTTDINGNYLFTGLVPGSYSVKFEAPAGYILTSKDSGANDGADSDADQTTGKTGNYTLASGDDNRTVDAGLVQKARIGDFVFEDKNANGVQDAGEAGIGGVTVTLCDAAGNPLATTTTNASGGYGFDVLPGTYSIKVSPPAGYVIAPKDAGGNDATDSDIDSAGKTGNYTLNSGDVNTTVDAGLYKKAQLGDRVWLDANGNGQQDSGEANVAGVTVNLLNAAGAVVATQTTNATGNYLFTDLTPGTYSVQFVAPNGYVITNKDSGADATDSDADTVTGKTATYTLQSGESNLTVDAGLFQKARIGDFVFEDKNANGVQDAGEAGIAGVTVTLCDAAGNPVSTTTTNASGGYGFDVAPGTYSVKVTAPADYFITTKDAGGDDAKDSDIDAAGKSGNYTLASGDVNNTVDGGLYKKASLGDRVWIDANGNGQQDSGEVGKSGVTVNLCNSAGVVVATQTTDINGNYLFTGLVPGSYAVQFVAPTGFTLTTKDSGADGTDSDADVSTGKTGFYTLASGDDNRTVDAGLVAPKARIGDFVWEDKNANGLQDAGEAGISGVTVNLKNAAGTVIATTTTAANGLYGFDVDAGTYSVQVIKPNGYVTTSKDAVGSDLSDSDIDATTGMTGNYTLAAGETNNSVDAGFYKTASIGDRVWLDCNSNGVQDSGEVGVAGVTVKLLDAAGNTVATQTTDANGNYLFTTLKPGSYALQFGTLSGYSLTTKDAGGNDANDSDADVSTGKTIYTTLDSGEDDRTWDAGLTPVCRPVTFDFSGNSATDGYDGNSRSYTDALTGVSVSARAFSQDKGTDNWQKAYLGAYGGGLGVTDSSEGNGYGDSHTIDNVGRNNYVVLQFSQDVKLDMAYLGYVVGDSDVQVWIGSSTSTITTMSNAVLASMGFSEVNTTTLTTARWADLNAGGATGNVIIIAADTTDTTPEDYFKLQQIAVCAPDYCAPVAKASIGDVVWEDKNYNGIQDAGEAGVANVTVKLLSSSGTVLSTTTTDSDGKYLFSNLNPGDYKIQVITPTGYFTTKKDQGGNDALDSDIDSTGTTVTTTLVAGENDLSWDAGIYRKATVGDKVWVDANHNSIQDSGEAGVANIKVALLNTAGNVLATTTTNSSGNYQFSNLDPGSYAVQFDKKDVNYNGVNLKEWMWGKKDIGSNDAIDSDVTGDGVSRTNVTKTDAFTLMSGQSDQTRDAAVTPLVIDLDGNGIRTISRADATGSFDLFGNGTAIKSGWVSGGDGLLAVDKNGNGKIDDINELFGGNAKGAGFASLAAFDSNHDGLVNSLDAQFGQLMVWRDANGNHQTDAGEMVSLAQAGVASLTVAYTELPFIDAQGNLHLERSSATLDSGASVDMTDVYFNVSADDAAAAGVALPTMADLLGDDRALDVVVGGSDMVSTCQVLRSDAADAANGCHGSDAGEVLRRLAALSREESHAAAA